MIKLYTGPMFSGKTTRLISELRRMVLGGSRCLLVRFKGDDRPTLTHDGVLSEPCDVMYLSHEGLGCIVSLKDYDVIAIDEAQFFSDLVDVCVTLKYMGCTVLVAGLISTYTAGIMVTNGDEIRANTRGNEIFPELNMLIPHTDELHKLTAICTNNCGNEALYSIRLSSHDGIQLIGGVESYAPRCLDCVMRK